jgi:hypothetical protein
VYRDFLQYYLCDIIIGSGSYTITKNKNILNAVSISQTEDCFDFRSKQYISINNITTITPRCVNLDYNPYLKKPEGEEYNSILNASIKTAELYLQLPKYIFSNTPLVNSVFDRYSISLQISKICPYFSKEFFSTMLTDNGAAEILYQQLVADNYDTIQRLCVAAVHVEAGISEAELFTISLDTLCNKFKEFWIGKLNIEKEKCIQELTVKINSTCADNIDGILIKSEIAKEISQYENLDIKGEINQLQYLGDVLRYYPFNDSGVKYKEFISCFTILKELKLLSVNRWHHKFYVLSCQLLNNRHITYYDIESNCDSVLLSCLKQIKVDSIEKTKQELVSSLTEEIEKLTCNTELAESSIVIDMKEIRDKVLSVDSNFDCSSIISAINYWPAILGEKPAAFR